MTAQDIKRGLGIWDLHYDYCDLDLWRRLLDFIKEYKPDYFVAGGDWFDFDFFSRWIKKDENLRDRENKRIKKVYTRFNEEIFKPLNKVLPNYCRKIWLEGNHDKRIDDYIDSHPEVEGYLEIEENIDLKDWEYYKENIKAKIGKMYFTHGQEVSGNNACRKIVTDNESNIFMGHFHREEIFTKIIPLRGDIHQGVIVGCLGKKNPDYMKNKPNAWVNGFLTFDVLPTGNFSYNLVTIIKDHFIFNGKFY